MTSDTEATEPTRRARPSRLILAVGCLVWLYVAGLVGVWLLIRYGGDRWWFATLMLFGPRWVYTLPLFVLVPAALFLRRRLLLPLALGAAILLWPIMGLCLPWRSLSGPSEPSLRVLTLNLHVDAVDPHEVLALIEQIKPDMVALQECDTRGQVEWPDGWHSVRKGELAIGSPYPLRDEQIGRRNHPPSRWLPINALAAVVETPQGDVTLVSVHLRTPRRGLEPVLSRRTLIDPSQSQVLTDEIGFRRSEAEDLRKWIDTLPGPVVIAGDLNMPTDSTIYRQCWSDRNNAFTISGWGLGHTKQSAVPGCEFGVRIDHILTGPEWLASRCWVAADVGSDHLPLVADLCRGE
ncbi:MAG: endonuclease/exonuclease/phosphatase family protein [Planctomycetota bacterium]